MAVLQKIRDFFAQEQAFEPETIVPAAPTSYTIRPLTDKHLNSALQLNLRCFRAGQNYTKYTFEYLLNEPNCLSYRAVAENGQMTGFIFIMIKPDGTGHITTIGVAPEHRRRGLGNRLLTHTENALRKRGISTITLEVRAGNLPAQNLYLLCGFSIVQRLVKYYNNGEDAFLMVKPI